MFGYFLTDVPSDELSQSIKFMVVNNFLKAPDKFNVGNAANAENHVEWGWIRTFWE